MDKERVNVLCMKWGTKYPAEYVNRLYSMVKRNLCRPFRFACLTDDPDGLESQICHYPLPTLKAELSGPERGWNKLGVFSEQLYDLQGQVLCLDLDLIITGKLDDFFDYFGDVVIIRDWVKRDGTGNSSVYRFEIGSHPDILNEFETKYEDIKNLPKDVKDFAKGAISNRKNWYNSLFVDILINMKKSKFSVYKISDLLFVSPHKLNKVADNKLTIVASEIIKVIQKNKNISKKELVKNQELEKFSVRDIVLEIRWLVHQGFISIYSDNKIKIT